MQPPKLPKFLHSPVYQFAILLIFIAGFFTIAFIFWDQFTWPYLWGPVVADANDTTYGDITAGYNIYNTIVYGLLIALAVFYIHQLLHYLKIRINIWFFLALTPYIWMGGAVRALEDASLFNTPAAYLFIAPVIYFTLGLSALAALVYGWWLSGLQGKKSLLGLAAALAALSASYYLVIINYTDQFNAIAGLALFALLSFSSFMVALVLYRRKGRISYNTVVFTLGLPFALLSLLLVVMWLWGRTWVPLDGPMRSNELWIISALAAGITGLIYGIGRFVPHERTRELLTHPINALIVLGHMLDASATYRGIDGYGYVEKHVLPGTLIDVTGTALVMYPLKLVVILLVLWMVDVAYEEELKGRDLLKGLLKLAIFVLGVAPGIRDMVRLAMGV